jgi:hypothetical protein
LRVTQAEIAAARDLGGREYRGSGIGGLFDEHGTEYTGIADSVWFGSPVFTSGVLEPGKAGAYPGDPTRFIVKLRGRDRVAFLSVLRNHMPGLDTSKSTRLEAICASSEHFVRDCFFMALQGWVIRLGKGAQLAPGSSQ